jgi:FKBP-type peptidyl-prolyl cis-trans isomerase 2
LLAQQITPAPGLCLDIRSADDTALQIVITEMNDDRFTIDANNRLVGRSLILQLDLLEIVQSIGVGFCKTPSE